MKNTEYFIAMQRLAGRSRILASSKCYSDIDSILQTPMAMALSTAVQEQIGYINSKFPNFHHLVLMLLENPDPARHSQKSSPYAHRSELLWQHNRGSVQH